MSDSPPAYWRLISVLFSTRSLDSEQARSLVETALGLNQRDESQGELLVGPCKGIVRNLRQHVNLGALAGPSFEAELDMEGGPATVRFFLTRDALALGEARRRAAPTLKN